MKRMDLLAANWLRSFPFQLTNLLLPFRIPPDRLPERKQVTGSPVGGSKKFYDFSLIALLT
jgi:hypothetical protein